MSAEDLRTLRGFLDARLWVVNPIRPTVIFQVPTERELGALGLDPDRVSDILASEWWPRMVADIMEAGRFCRAAEGPDGVLRFARQVLWEALRANCVPDSAAARYC